MYSKITIFILFLCLGTNPIDAQISPWGTGTTTNQLLGDLDDTTVVFASQSGWGNYGFYPNPNALLANYTYDIYVPTSYNGLKPFGLITFINSGNNGGLISSWIPVLEEKNLILIAGDNIGNPINVDIRMGVAMAAVYRMKELLNIDSTRIYTSGNSGGARMASVLAYTYPEWFFGSVPNCGSSYLRQVDQDYETYSPNSNYEYTIPFSTADLNYVKSFDRRYGIMTSFDDFREGDIMNIYHNGMMEDGIKGKFLELAGPHCTTSTEHFRDAINFIEHPHITKIADDFDAMAIVGNGFKLAAANLQNSKLNLMHSSNTLARAYSRDLFQWNDAKGSILTTTVACDSASYNQNSVFHIGMYGLDQADTFCDTIGSTVLNGRSSILTTIVYDGLQPTLYLILENPTLGISSDTIFQATFSDWTAANTLDIKYHLWDKEMRVEFSNHFSTPTISSTSAKLLDDDRSVRVRWNELTANATYWGTNDWKNGTLLTYAAERINSALASSELSIDYLNLVFADTTSVLELPIEQVVLQQNGNNLSVPTGLGAYQWFLDGNALPSDTSNTLNAVQSGNYHLSIYTGSNCEVLSDTQTVVLSAISDIENSPISIYPNPNKGEFNIVLGEEGASVELLTTMGQSILSRELISGTNIIRTNRLAAGLYFLKIRRANASKTETHKVIIQQ
ncbi:MAG: T9SS type A sorting domain-containing protein [Aureispira sp.]|nr:T9SS type A sorting domain-containing protein [Aureispira sp.]